MNLHPKMAAWLHNELVNGCFEAFDDEEQAIADQTLDQLNQELQKPPVGSLTVEVGRDAIGYYRRTFTGGTLHQLKDRMTYDGLDDKDLVGLTPDWFEEGFSAYDDVSVYRVFDHEGNEIYKAEMA